MRQDPYYEAGVLFLLLDQCLRHDIASTCHITSHHTTPHHTASHALHSTAPHVLWAMTHVVGYDSLCGGP